MYADPTMHVSILSGNIYPLLAGRIMSDIPLVGGAETQQLLIARGLRDLGIHVSFITEDYGQGRETVVDGFRVHAFVYGRNKVRQGVTLWRAMDRASPDLLYIRGVPRYVALIAANAVRRRRPLVIGMSNNRMSVPRPLSGLTRLEDVGYRYALARAGAVIAQTAFQQASLAKHYGVRDAIVVPNGALPSRVPFRDHPERLRAVWIATLRPLKGLPHLFEIASRTPDMIFDVIASPARGERAYYEEMKARAAAIPNVCWHGTVPPERVDSILAGAIALVHTTLPQPGICSIEGFPNVYLEAWRNGAPVLAYDADPDGVLEREGIGYRCHDAEAMAACLARLRTDASAWRRMSEAALRYFEREHRIDRTVAGMLSVFERVVGARAVGANAVEARAGANAADGGAAAELRTGPDA